MYLLAGETGGAGGAEESDPSSAGGADNPSGIQIFRLLFKII